MDSSDEKVLLECCCYHQEQIKREWNRTWVWTEQGIYQNLLQAIGVNDIEDRITDYLYKEPFSKINKEKCAGFQNMA